MSNNGQSSTRWRPSRPVRIAGQAAIAAILGSFGAYVVMTREFTTPYQHGRQNVWFRLSQHMRFEGTSAVVLGVGFLLMAAGVAILMLKEIGTESGGKIDRTLGGALIGTGLVLIAGIYAVTLFGRL
ncbi:MAG: hypothetical protein K2P80_15770 [Beijerinckiaceae bacterium]|nr:hypothetical protein [Beijerinckiaceae bacterium]